MYAEAGVQVTPAGKTGTPPVGPMSEAGACEVVSWRAAEQPLPSHAASKSTEKRPSANIETMPQFWLGRVTPGGKKPARATEYVPAVLLLFRLKYIQPPTSPEVDIGGKIVVLAAEYAPVSGMPGAPGGAGETPPGAFRIVAFSCSSKRTTSAIGMFELLLARMPAPVQAPIVMPSRQILKFVLNAPVPPLMKRAAHAVGSGWRRSIVRGTMPAV